MILYHGSYLEIIKPDLVHSRVNVDFGRGFYTTPFYEQAVSWCRKFRRRGKDGIISLYEFDEKAYQELRVLNFDSYSEEWLDFIVSCRSGKSHPYDIVEGPMADDQIWTYIEDFISTKITRTAFWELAKFQKPTHQISFHTINALLCLKFVQAKEV